MTGKWSTRAAAIFPFIVFRDESQIQSWVINHELIHFRQFFDTFFIGLPLLTFFEQLYALIILRKSKPEAYLYAASEQEAYRNQQNFEYLKHRKFGTVFRYVRDKRDFTWGEPGEIVYKD